MQRVASDNTKHAVQCTTCGYGMRLSDAEMATAQCPKCAEDENNDGDNDGDEDDDVDTDGAMKHGKEHKAVNFKVTNPNALSPGATLTLSNNQLDTGKN